MKTVELDIAPVIRELIRDELSKRTDGQSQQGASDYMTPEQVRKEYHISQARLYRKINSGQLSLYHFGERSLLKRSDIEKLIIKGPPRPPRYIPKGPRKPRSESDENA